MTKKAIITGITGQDGAYLADFPLGKGYEVYDELNEFDSGKGVVGFLEKPSQEEIARLNINTINAGIYILEPRVLQYIPDGEKYSFEYHLFPQLLAQKENFHVFATDNYWLDIGTPQRYLQANQDVIGGRLKSANSKRNNRFQTESAAEIDDKSIIADGCVIETGAKIYSSVIGKDCVVRQNSAVRNSVIWDDSEIGSNCEINDSVVGYKCRIVDNTMVENRYLPDMEIYQADDLKR